ncbi:hypothetical protein [Methylocystis heyeri]|uniref:Uncharacterized protein n=1 Tax=Methylocystis heyeri TaxID=391905 RepID=A0A6B8KC83_9HYPH|nr:hypothetical protein [Methylocystis heyeri]QGM45826.1 hypothetical protein H2LOC_008995 [Methylocystis heyeri]
MSTSDPDAMVIQASGFGEALTARLSIQRAKQIMLDLEAISPWQRPFKVSGRTEETNRMPIAADLSDFDEVVMRALQSYTAPRYYNENDPDNWELTPDSYSPLGFAETFSDIHSGKGYWDSICLHLYFASVKNLVASNDSVYVLKVPFYQEDQVNREWSDPAVVRRLLDYFIDSCNSEKCVVYGRQQNRRISLEKNIYAIGWLNYTRDPKVAEVFRKTGKAAPYRAGVLLKLGDDASVLSDSKIDAELLEISEMLSAAGVSR